jgi:carbon storage regulator
MLVLSRKKNESIIIDGHIVTVVEIRGDKIKLGIEAPREINVDRLEVWEAKQRNHISTETSSS